MVLLGVLTPLCCFLLFSSGVSAYTEFEISVPSQTQVGVYGQSMVLSCSFPVGSSWDLDNTVITWQRHLEVIHSFYHGQDQLSHQSPHFAKRTKLYYEEMKKGNASLRLDRATIQDEGVYTCSVSTPLGSQKKSFRLKIGALYPEPRLHITLLSNGQVDLLLSSHGGYPSPSLQWLMGDMEDVTNETYTELKQDEHTRLYSVNSKLNLTRGINSSISFILRNEELGQEMRRNIDLSSENRDTEKKDLVIILVPIIVGMLIFGILIAVFIIYRQHDYKRPPSPETPDSDRKQHKNQTHNTSITNGVESVTEALIKLPRSPVMPFRKSVLGQAQPG